MLSAHYTPAGHAVGGRKDQLGLAVRLLRRRFGCHGAGCCLGIRAGQSLAYSAVDSKRTFRRLRESTAGYRSSGGKSKADFISEMGDMDIRRKFKQGQKAEERDPKN